MKRICSYIQNQSGLAPLLLVSVIGVLVLLAVSSLVNFKDFKFSQLYPKSESEAHHVSGIMGHGLVGTYYDTKNLSGNSKNRTDAYLNFNWGLKSPIEGIPSDNFSVRWKGLIATPTSGEYTFYVFSDDGVRLWVDNKLIIDRWFDHPPYEFSGKINLEANKGYTIMLEYYENIGGSNITLSWAGPYVSKQTIPTLNLFDGSDAPANADSHPAEIAEPQSPISSIPLCQHDPTKYHGLVERNPDNSIKCTYTHEHKDDPRVLDNIFGSVGEYTNGQEISYPWQTHSTSGPENHAKHRVYNWNVAKDMPCIPSNAPYGFNNIRAQYHADGNSGAAVRFHSYFVQAQACDPKNPNWRGKITLGGHMDYGALYNDPPLGRSRHIALPLDPPNPSIQSDRRLHGAPDGVRCDFTWYGSNRNVNFSAFQKVQVLVGIRKEDWGPVDPNDPNKLILGYSIPNHCATQNGSYHEPVHSLHINITPDLDWRDGKPDGLVNFRGHTDRYGNILYHNCSPIGPDCVPIVIENMKVGSYQYRADVHKVQLKDYDVKVNGKSLIQYPN